MPYLNGSGITQADGSTLQDASGNDLAEQDWDFSALTATISGQGEEVLTRIGLPQSDLFGDLKKIIDDLAITGVVPELTIGKAVADLLTALTNPAQPGTSLRDLVDSIFSFTQPTNESSSNIPWQIKDFREMALANFDAILGAIGGSSPGGGGDELARIPAWGDFYYAPAWPGTNPAATVVDGAPMVAGETRLAYLARVAPDLSWGTWHNGDGLVSAPLDEVGGGPRIVFRYTEDEWIAKGGGARGGGGNPGSPDNQEILDAISALRGGTATVQNAYDDVEGARSDISDLAGDVTALRGGTATVQGVLDAVNALEIPTPPSAATIAAAVWAELLSGTSAGARLITASGITLDLSPVTTAISDLRGGTATVQGVLDAVNALEIPDPPTAAAIAAAVWAYIVATSPDRSASYQLNLAAAAPDLSGVPADVWAHLISGIAASTLLHDAAFGTRLLLPPAWPGNANVTLGTPVPFDDSFSVDVACDGAILTITTEPTRAGQYVLGDATYYYGTGRIAFGDDQGHVEPWVYTGFASAVYLPRTMKHAAHVHVQVDRGMEGTLTPFTITQ